MEDVKAQALSLAKKSATRAHAVVGAIQATALQENSSMRLEMLRAQHDVSNIDKAIEEYRCQLIESRRQIAREAYENDINLTKKSLINDYRCIYNFYLLQARTVHLRE